MKTSMMTMTAMMMAATTLVAATSETRIPTLKVGKCAITLLDSNGIKPLSGATLDLKQAENGKTAVSAVANKSGLCEITVAEGRYVLSINEKPVTLLNATKDGEMAWARIVVSESPMMVGGQEGATEATVTYTLLGVKYTTWAAAVAAAAVAGVGINAIVENNEGGSSNNNTGDNVTNNNTSNNRNNNDDGDDAPPASL
jgi:hypothetical protein